jgi:DNA polymerase V
MGCFYMVSHGGKRANAGRPKGQGKYGETTKLMRVPISRTEDVKAFLDDGSSYQFPLYGSAVRAGFTFMSVLDVVNKK